MGNISSFEKSSPPEGGWPEYERPPMPDAGATARLLQEMSQGSLGPINKLQEALGMTIEQIADWMAQPRHRFVAANLVNLYDVQTQLMVCQHRLIAVARLAEVAAKADSPETVRRACKDLLAVRLIDPYREDERPEKPPPPPPESEADTERILEALERLGGDDYGPRREKEKSGEWGSEAAPERGVLSGPGQCASARAEFTDGAVKAHLPAANGGSAREAPHPTGAPERAQTKHHDPADCARDGSGGESRGGPKRGDSRPNSSERAPPRGTVRCY